MGTRLLRGKRKWVNVLAERKTRQRNAIWRALNIDADNRMVENIRNQLTKKPVSREEKMLFDSIDAAIKKSSWRFKALPSPEKLNDDYKIASKTHAERIGSVSQLRKSAKYRKPLRVPLAGGGEWSLGGDTAKNVVDIIEERRRKAKRLLKARKMQQKR